MANCTLCRPPSTWLELTNINIVGGPKLLWMVTDKGKGERLIQGVKGIKGVVTGSEEVKESKRV